ncbi:MAG: peptidylprolyl isomerase [Deltaproteobacteria bacterium]|mgnify:CR=1 FL=1|nr:peptidylprolyl isomerase [Deltaproteobacteria bacterium]MDH3850226.1 peptidylprolyl isomerase [Deltaproteobacteria bacterium]MDH3897209.1 peptidylprolyl isomerase [Deltaproteobacteria bacterium]MDH3928527.1 peptidylprolyl isomerase [Deltaproteobacteria bacterium]MDH3950132.1 peptidylprolyl isomerase [Deltaproteobacteria bacterium]
MAQAKAGDTVRVHYEGQLSDGTIFDSSLEREPIEFILGQDTVIPGFEQAVIGMEVGESKDISIPPEEGFGDYSEDLVVNIEKTILPPDINPELGMQLEVSSEEEETSRVFTIADIAEDSITLDGNHPLAGAEIAFKIELLEIL